MDAKNNDMCSILIEALWRAYTLQIQVILHIAVFHTLSTVQYT